MSEAFHLTAREFDAYLPERATSNAHSRPRIEVKQRALVWARAVLARIAEQGASLDVTPSDEVLSLKNGRRVDCQWILFRRTAAWRERLDALIDQGRPISELLSAPGWYRRHALLAMRVDSGSVRVGFGLYPDARLDLDDLRAALDTDEALVDAVAAVLRQLPDQFTLGPVDLGADLPRDADLMATSAVEIGALRELLHGVARGERGLWIGWSVPRDVALSHSEILGEQLADATLALLPILGVLAWSPERDHLGLEERLQRLRRERDETHAEAAAEQARWTEQRRLDLERARETRDLSAAGGATLLPQIEASQRGGVSSSPARSRTSRHSSRPPQPREQARVEATALELGARVRVCSGVFGGRQGVVAELDGRGGARILFGLLSARIDVGDLEPIALGRPSLMSSHHRRPLAAKPGANPGPAPRKAR